MKKEYTKAEKQAYYKALRERWQAAKNVGDEDEVKAIMMAHGLNFSFRSYMFVKLQMNTLGLDGIPYVDAKTFMGWKENGFMVRKGEKSQIDGLTWLAINGKEVEAPTEGDDEKHGFVMPKCYHLFHRSQVEASLKQYGGRASYTRRGGIVKTLTQVFYGKFAAYPREALQSKEGRRLIAKAARLIHAKEGAEEARYFINLMTVSEVIE